MARTAAVDARRSQLLAVGKRVFSSRAYDDVSTEDLASEAGISVGLLYHYFANKKGFYVETIRVATAELLEVVRFAPGVPLAQSAPGAVLAFLDFVEANARLYQGLMRGGVGADAQVHEIVEGVRTTLMERVFAAAEVTPDPVLRVQLYGWIGLVEFSALRWLSHHEVDRATLLGLLLGSVPPRLLETSA
jgi:AcrR family transcriptional regulator